MQCTVVPSPVMMLELFHVLLITLSRYGFFIRGWPKGYFANSTISCHLYRSQKKKIEFQLALGQVHPVINRPLKSGYINGLAIKGVLK